MAGQPVIELKQLTKKYGDFTAVNQLTLDIYQGEIFGLLGPNGAGKTTTILMMLGLTEPTSGQALVCGINATRNPIQVKSRVGYLPDDVGFYDDRTALDNLVYTARLNRIPLREAKERAMSLLERVGLAEAAEKNVGEFSRGMRQRLGLADVLIKRPEVIILDEPTLGIDPEGVRELLALIRELSRNEGITVLLSSHHLHQVQQICDRVGLFVKGRLIACGDMGDLSRQLFGGATHTVELDLGEWSDELEQRIKSLDHVVSVERVEADALEGSSHVTARVICSDDLAPQLARMALEMGVELHGLRPTKYGLDDIYHRYFEGGEAS